ncbi:hypothetical protein H8K35_06465 [Undibacterium sp. LX40W]|uniref:TniQ protein n=1 Tax=Undibacterium nitidum TaxID=2762298 RepID=A0A923HHM4_9BURK|nr:MULTISPECIES: hypothetical protein [Undibacterium]MBC3879970.1 hypothetical protein [Undibacterium nitidum]MBC3891294.1 hypothetical protein [Undibacterium sp. LX40W]
MKPYPKVNWWPGNLIPYESCLSFAVRFCALNNLGLKQFEQYFEIKIDGLASVSSSQIRRIADLLNEDLDAVKTIFSPTSILGKLSDDRFFLRSKTLAQVRVCDECVANGYHNFLHQVSWLAKCPFHNTSLRVIYVFSGGQSKTSQRFLELKHAMETCCKSWPYLQDIDKSFLENENFNRVLMWAKCALDSEDQLLKGLMVRFGSDSEYEEQTLKQTIGQLRSLEVIPQKIEHLFATLGETWQIELRRFPLDVKNNLKQATKLHDLRYIFSFFKSVGKYANRTGSYLDKLKSAQAKITQNYSSSRCSWGLRKDGFYSHWEKVDPDNWPHWCCQRPYEVAIEDLELGWGRAENILSSRKLEQERLSFVRESKTFYDEGFIGYTPEAQVSEDGRLYLYPQNWPCCEWVDKFMLGDLLNTIAEFEIEIAFECISIWLHDIELGKNPNERQDPRSCIYLCESEDGITVFKWFRRNEAIDIL